jgi:hypothetical protein
MKQLFLTLSLLTLLVGTAVCQEVTYRGDTLQVAFPLGSAELGQSIPSLLKQYPQLKEMIACAATDPRTVVVVSVSCDTTSWVPARKLSVSDTRRLRTSGALDGGKVIDREMLGIAIVEAAGLQDLVNEARVLHRRADTRYLKIYPSLITDLPPEQPREVVYDTVVVIVDSTKHYDTSPPLFGGVTVSVSSAPQSHAVFCAGVRLNIRPRLVADAKIGHSVFTNDRLVSDGTSVEAYGMLYSASIMYVLAQRQDERDSLWNNRIGAVFGVTQVENDTKSTFDYLIKRRVAEAGLAFEYKSVGVRGLIGYGWDEYYDRLDVDYKTTGRLELTVTL